MRTRRGGWSAARHLKSLFHAVDNVEWNFLFLFRRPPGGKDLIRSTGVRICPWLGSGTLGELLVSVKKGKRLVRESVVGTAWTQDENEATIEAYFSLFLADLSGEPINKAATYRRLAVRFGRAAKAFEFKMLNISAVLVRLG